jgi:hypothetical protein
MKSLEIYEKYITLFCSGKIKLFYNILLTQNHAWHFPKVIEITINIQGADDKLGQTIQKHCKH